MLDALRPVLWRQHGAVTVGQLTAAGVTRSGRRALVRRGWTTPVRGVLVQPQPRDAFRAHVSAALLARPAAAACRVTAARLLGLWVPAVWVPAELPHVALPARGNATACCGMLAYRGLRSGDVTVRDRLRTTGIDRTLRDLSTRLPPDDVVCLVDSALRLGWSPGPLAPRSALARALRRADPLSESALETYFRLLFTAAGLAPECLQHRMFGSDGTCYARLDFAWPSCKVGVKIDGREVHDLPGAAYRDRAKQNRASLDGWVILRFTWADLRDTPELVIAQLAAALRAGLH